MIFFEDENDTESLSSEMSNSFNELDETTISQSEELLGNAAEYNKESSGDFSKRYTSLSDAEYDYLRPYSAIIPEKEVPIELVDLNATTDIQEKTSDTAPVTFDIKEIPLNIDPNPVIITKKPLNKVHYTQNVSLKFLKPPTPVQPGDIVIEKERDTQAPPVAPLLIRQRPPEPIKPPVLVVREKPPPPPAPIAPQIFNIPGKIHPPPPRQMVVERLPKLPSPPQDIIIERWLNYTKRTRRVIYEPAPELMLAPAPKNLIIQWDTPAIEIQKEFIFLGVAKVDPDQYISQYASLLASAGQLPEIAVEHFKPPLGQTLGVDYRPDLPRLVGDIEALRLIDLNAEGLGDYASYLKEYSL